MIGMRRDWCDLVYKVEKIALANRAYLSVNQLFEWVSKNSDSEFTFLDSPFGMAVQSAPHNDSVVYLLKGECHIAQYETEGIIGLTERGEMDKTGLIWGGWEAGNS